MGIADFCVRNPVSVTVGILLAVLFGTIALLRLPIQMIPTVDRPEITVETDYRGAAPLEVEREVTDRLEEKLNAVEHLKQVSSTSIEGNPRSFSSSTGAPTRTWPVWASPRNWTW